MKHNLDQKIEKLFHIIFPYYKGELNMKNSKTKKPFEAKIGEKTYSIKKCVRVKTKDGKTFFKPIKEDDISLCFVDDRNYVVGEVKKGSNFFQQLLLLVATKISSKKK